MCRIKAIPLTFSQPGKEWVIFVTDILSAVMREAQWRRIVLSGIDYFR